MMLVFRSTRLFRARPTRLGLDRPVPNPFLLVVVSFSLAAAARARHFRACIGVRWTGERPSSPGRVRGFCCVGFTCESARKGKTGFVFSMAEEIDELSADTMDGRLFRTVAILAALELDLEDAVPRESFRLVGRLPRRNCSLVLT